MTALSQRDPAARDWRSHEELTNPLLPPSPLLKPEPTRRRESADCIARPLRLAPLDALAGPSVALCSLCVLRKWANKNDIFRILLSEVIPTRPVRALGETAA